MNLTIDEALQQAERELYGYTGDDFRERLNARVAELTKDTFKEDAAVVCAELMETLGLIATGEKSISALGFLTRLRQETIARALSEASRGCDQASVDARIASISDGL